MQIVPKCASGSKMRQPRPWVSLSWGNLFYANLEKEKRNKKEKDRVINATSLLLRFVLYKADAQKRTQYFVLYKAELGK